MLRIYRSLAEVPVDAPPSALTIGNFDGVHYAHQRIMRRVVEVARERGLTPSVLTFDPHPTRVVAPSRAPRLLSTPEQRLALMEAEGIEQVFLLPFDQHFSEMSALSFIHDLVLGKLHAKAVLVGSNFHFGHKQQGDTELLVRLGSQEHFYTEIVSGIQLRHRWVSSTEVRTLVEKGNVSMACRMLNRPYFVEGEIVRGHGIGSKQTVPTLNLKTAAEVLPANGVYVTRTEDLKADRQWDSITNIGTRPTFDGDALTIETFLLDPLEGDTPEAIRLEFLRRVRPEQKFASPEELKQQIFKDVGVAKKYLRRLRRVGTLSESR